MEDDHSTTLSHHDSDLDLSFTSSTSIATTSARSSLASLSFTDSTRISSVSTATSSTSLPNLHPRPHRNSDANWSAIRTAANLSADRALHLHHFKLVRHLGSGNLGRVFLCKLRENDHASFALKVVDKNMLTCKKLLQVETEARVLSALDHPFVPTLFAHIEAAHYACFLIDYCPNGDLHSVLRKQPGYRFAVDVVRFYAAEVLVALEYLHSIGIVYRDLKPENILIRDNGHIMLSDFDLCFDADVVPKVDRYVGKRVRSRLGLGFFGRREEEETVTEFFAEPTTAFSKTCVGTHEYLAPELVTGDGHGSGVDWWAFGVLIYELLHGRTPFRGGSKESTLRNIQSMKVNFNEMDKRGMTQAKDLIEKLLVKDPKERLGCARGATDIKQHPFFDGIKWPLIRMYRPPEVRGVSVKKSGKAHGSHVGGWSQKKRRSLWKGIKCILLKHKGVKC